MTKSNSSEVIAYYDKTESRLGYKLILNGTKHFGFYGDGDRPWSFGPAMLRMSDRLGDFLEQAPGSKVLDAGCGVGDVARRLANTRGLEVVGIDILGFNIEEARRRSAEDPSSGHVSFSVMDYSSLQFPDETFDAVYTMETLVHAASASNVLAGFRRVLKPGGRIVHFEYSHVPYDEMPREASRVFQEINRVAAMPSFDEFNFGRLEALLAESGFEDVTCADISRNIWPMLQSFYLLGLVPYEIARVIGKVGKLPNAMSGVELWKYRHLWRYNVVAARKPL